MPKDGRTGPDNKPPIDVPDSHDDKRKQQDTAETALSSASWSDDSLLKELDFRGKNLQPNNSAQTPKEAISRALREPQISCRTVASTLRFLEETEGSELAEQVIQLGGLPRSYLENHANWVSSGYVASWTRNVCRELTGLQELPEPSHPHWQHYREAGRQSMQVRYLGPIFWVIRALGSASVLYAQLPRQVERANRTISMAFSELGPGRVSIEVKQKLPNAFGTAHCWNTRGILETIPTIWRGPLANVEHTNCMHDPIAPAESCLYRISFQDRLLSRMLKLTAPALLAIGGAVGAALVTPAAPALAATAAGAGIAALIGWQRAMASNRRRLRDMGVLEAALEQADQNVQRLWEEKQRHHRALLTSRKLSGYLSAELVEQVLKSPDTAPQLGGEEVEAAVLFADIVGFTARSENVKPAQVVRELNHYFSYIDPVIEQFDGVLDKRMGDGIMVVFVPRDDEAAIEHRRRALCCGLALLRTVQEQNPLGAKLGIAPLQIRVGIAAGPTVRGNLGSHSQIEYTVIGDTVNLGSRLESSAEPGRLMVTKNIFDAARTLDLEATEISRQASIQVRGRDQTQETVELAIEPIKDR